MGSHIYTNICISYMCIRCGMCICMLVLYFFIIYICSKERSLGRSLSEFPVRQAPLEVEDLKSGGWNPRGADLSREEKRRRSGQKGRAIWFIPTWEELVHQHGEKTTEVSCETHGRHVSTTRSMSGFQGKSSRCVFQEWQFIQFPGKCVVSFLGCLYGGNRGKPSSIHRNDRSRIKSRPIQ